MNAGFHTPPGSGYPKAFPGPKSDCEIGLWEVDRVVTNIGIDNYAPDGLVRMARSAVLRAYPKAADAEDWHLKVREASANLKSALRAAQKARKKLERAYEIVDALPLGLPFADLQSIPVARSTDVFNLIKNFQSLEEALLPTEEEDRNLFSTMFSLRSWLVGGLPSRTKNRRSHTQLKIGQRKTSVTSSEQQGGTLASAVPIRPQS